MMMMILTLGNEGVKGTGVLQKWEDNSVVHPPPPSKTIGCFPTFVSVEKPTGGGGNKQTHILLRHSLSTFFGNVKKSLKSLRIPLVLLFYSEAVIRF